MFEIKQTQRKTRDALQTNKDCQNNVKGTTVHFGKEVGIYFGRTGLLKWAH